MCGRRGDRNEAAVIHESTALHRGVCLYQSLDYRVLPFYGRPAWPILILFAQRIEDDEGMSSSHLRRAESLQGSFYDGYRIFAAAAADADNDVGASTANYDILDF